jgi:Asp-tRNA(Asn)/Glu-tRNA(Gln) amidotransferase A subunit family amidase
MKPILCAKAATGGHLEVLKWLRGKGCNWTEKVLENATDNANLHIMRYAIENGCKWNPEWTLHDLENIDDQEKSLAASRHHRKVQTGTVHENFGEDFQWIIQRAHQQIADDKLAAEEKQRRKDEKERRAAQKRKAD